ncbi:MAG: hypothetical protein JKY43_05960 [Phycisphaerales bacterium]|nr:hypothetical protein [Phycisphaerales bacterium]
MRTLATIGYTCLLASTMLLGGCLVSSAKATRIDGAYVQPNTVSKVKINHTTAQEVEELLGLPSTMSDNDDGSETWTWNWTKESGDAGAVFLIFAGEKVKVIHESVHIKFVDGIAVKKWRD